MVEAMDAETLLHFKSLLNTWLEDLLRQASHTVVAMRNTDGVPIDPLDRAIFDFERSFQLRISDRESVLIRKIRRSLQDIEDGTYGICEMCGEEIDIRRLEARPVARHCIQCKTKTEIVEKLTGT